MVKVIEFSQFHTKLICDLPKQFAFLDPAFDRLELCFVFRGEPVPCQRVMLAQFAMVTRDNTAFTSCQLSPDCLEIYALSTSEIHQIIMLLRPVLA